MKKKAHGEFEKYDTARRLAADAQPSDFDKFVAEVNKEEKKRVTKKPAQKKKRDE